MQTSSALFKFSTDDFPEKGRETAWRDHFGEAIVKMDLKALGDEPFRSVSHIRAFPDLNLWWCSITESEVRRTQSHLTDDEDSVVFAVVRKGRSVTRQGGREEVFGHGEGLLWSAGRTGVFRNLGAASMVCMKFSRRSLSATVRDLDAAFMRTVPASNEALHLLTSYVEVLHGDAAPLPPALVAIGIPHIQDLVSLALGATRDAAETARTGGLATARLHAIKAYIFGNLADSTLSIDSVAARYAISSRYIRTLFERENTSFTDFVREQRLRRAYRMLSDSALLDPGIGHIAVECGFVSVSYFNQAFRRRYGVTPGDVRNAATMRNDL